MKGSWHDLEGTFWDRQRQKSNVECACGCGGFISNRSAKAKAKGTTEGFLKGHQHKKYGMSENARLNMSRNHADVSGNKNPNYGKGLFGEDNPNWQGGKKEKHYTGSVQNGGYYSSKDRNFRGFIKWRDKKCILCGNKTRLTVHHIEPWVEREDLRFDPSNAVTLCIRCHPRADNKHHKATVKPMLKAYANSL